MATTEDLITEYDLLIASRFQNCNLGSKLYLSRQARSMPSWTHSAAARMMATGLPSVGTGKRDEHHRS